eukprot:jgi/Botrbrau1/12742/Bobra.67_1s0101.1
MNPSKRRRSPSVDSDEDDEMELEEYGEVPFADCLLVSKSGRTYPSIKGILALRSPVFRELLAGCVSGPGQQNSSETLQIPLSEHDDKEVILLWRQLHGIKPILGNQNFVDLQSVDIKKRTEEVFLLTEIAHKFDVKEVLDDIESFLCIDRVFEKCAFPEHVTTDRWHYPREHLQSCCKLWIFGCQYGLPNLLRKIEGSRHFQKTLRIKSHPPLWQFR